MVTFATSKMQCKITGLAIDLERVFRCMQHEQNCYWLDSAGATPTLGRYSILGANPSVVFKSYGNRIVITEKGIEREISGDALLTLRVLLKRFTKPRQLGYEDIPFVGGWVGYFGYDLKNHIEAKIFKPKSVEVEYPDIFLAYYERILVIDHGLQIARIFNQGICECEENAIEAYLRSFDSYKSNEYAKPYGKFNKVKVTSNFTQEDYKKRVNKVKAYIASGDIYQANLAQRFKARIPTTPAELDVSLGERKGNRRR